MKKKLILLALCIPLILFAVMLNLVSWRPKFVVKDPTLTADHKWSSDGRTVRISSYRQSVPGANAELAPPTYSYFDVRTRQRLPNEDSSWNFDDSTNSKFKLKSNFSDSMTEKETIDYILHFKETSLSLCSADGKNCRSLPDTPAAEFKMGVDEKGEFKTAFSNSRISSDDSQLLIVGGGEMRIWRTSDGTLKKSTPLALVETITKTVIDPDIHTVIALLDDQLDQIQPKAQVFDTATGKNSFTLPGERIMDFDFSPDGKSIWSLTSTIAAGPVFIKLSFYNSKNGQLLWECQPLAPVKPMFLPEGKALILPGATGLELRSTGTGQVERTFTGPADILGASISPDGRTVWTNHRDGTIWNWRIS